MFRFLFSTLFGAMLVGGAYAQAYTPPEFEESAFDLKKLGLMEVERQKFATNLAGYVVNEVKVKENAHKAEWARKLLGLALHLDRRNRAALIANHQFGRGVAPKKVKADYKPEALAKLLAAQSKALVKLGGEDNVALSGLLLAAAVEIDSENEDAVYDLELHKLDVGDVNWSLVTDKKPKVKAAEKK